MLSWRACPCQYIPVECVSCPTPLVFLDPLPCAVATRPFLLCGTSHALRCIWDAGGRVYASVDDATKTRY
eukprot:m.198446 g.198446  ORF g.198446 m.198446 type:complete len:70 (-) comp20449_c0_seq1:51-260(-)